MHTLPSFIFIFFVPCSLPMTDTNGKLLEKYACSVEQVLSRLRHLEQSDYNVKKSLNPVQWQINKTREELGVLSNTLLADMHALLKDYEMQINILRALNNLTIMHFF